MSVPPGVMTGLTSGQPVPGGSTTSGNPLLSDIGSAVGIGGNLYSLLNSIQLSNTANQNLAQSNPFGAYRPIYGQQLLSLMQDPSSVTSLPGYQFQLGQGAAALDRSAAAPGGVGFGSGAEGAQLEQFGQGLASSFYNNQIQTLAALAGSGIAPSNAASMIGASGAAAGGIGSSITGLTNSTLGLLNKLFPGTSSSSAPASTDYSQLGINLDPSSISFQSGPGSSGGYNDLSGVYSTQNILGSSNAGLDLGSTDTSAGVGGGIDLTDLFSGPSTAGGVAATGGAPPVTGTTAGTTDVGRLFSGVGPGTASAASILSIMQGLQSGGATGTVQAGIGATSLANRAGAFGSTSPQVGYGLTGVSGLLQLMQGLKQGGVAGYGGAAVGGLETASAAEGLAGDAAESGALGTAAGYVAAPLAVYNFAQNWQSGKTGSDALMGAEAGAAVGSVIPVVGTVLGAVIGGVIGGASSLFGGGATDPETKNWQSFINATGGANATQAQVQAAAAGMSPQSAFNLLSGVMDIKDNRIPIVNTFGRMGESNLLNQMTTEINSAITGGKISGASSPDQIYSQIVEPWLNSKGATITPETGGLQLQAVLTNLIGSWQSGQLTSGTQLTSSGSRDLNLPAYGG